MKNSNTKRSMVVSVFLALFFFGAMTLMESSAWARAGGGGSSGSRGSRSFSSPARPSNSSPGSPELNPGGRPTMPQTPQQPSSPGFFSRSPFLQGMAGGLAGGLLGGMLFGGMGHASTGGGFGGGIGFLDILILGALLFFAWRFFKRRREQSLATAESYGGGEPSNMGGYSPAPPSGSFYQGHAAEYSNPASEDLERGIGHIRAYDPSFNEEAFKETVQDLFFRIQAGWMNRSLTGMEGLFTAEMAETFKREFDTMRRKGQSNRLENIAVRKVELSEAWQETGKDYATVLITANLLDYTVDDGTGQVIQGDKLNPVKFQEYWTFCREIGSSAWRLSAINQASM